MLTRAGLVRHERLREGRHAGQRKEGKRGEEQMKLTLLTSVAGGVESGVCLASMENSSSASRSNHIHTHTHANAERKTSTFLWSTGSIPMGPTRIETHRQRLPPSPSERPTWRRLPVLHVQELALLPVLALPTGHKVAAHISLGPAIHPTLSPRIAAELLASALSCN